MTWTLSFCVYSLGDSGVPPKLMMLNVRSNNAVFNVSAVKQVTVPSSPKCFAQIPVSSIKCLVMTVSFAPESVTIRYSLSP